MLKLSLKAKITLVIAGLGAGLVAVLSALTYMPLHSALVKQEHASLQHLNGATVKRAQVLLVDLDSAVQTWGTSDFLRANPVDKDGSMSRYLRDQQSAHRGFISRIFVVDSNGAVVGASDRALVGHHVSDFWRGGEVNEQYSMGPESAPHSLAFSDHPTIALSKTFEFSNNSAGAVVAYLNWSNINEQQIFVTRGETGERQDAALTLLLNEHGMLLGASSQGISQQIAETTRPVERLQDVHINLEGGIPAVGQPFSFEYDNHRYDAVRANASVNALGRELTWTIISGRDEQLLEADLNTARWNLFGGGLVMVVLSSLVGFFVASGLSSSLLMLVPSFERLAAGDLDCTVQCSTGDEIELISRHFNAFVAKLRSIVVNIVDSTRTLSESSSLLGDLSQNLVGNAQETSSQAGAASKISDEVSTNINTVSAGVEEMSLSINEIARSSDEAARVATSAVRIAEMTNTTVAELGGSSSEIGNVIKVINSIAEQTNLLALNATIEAARAGEAGKGFAVVANEVKELAKETARATEDIGKKIEAIQAKTKGAVNAIGEIGSIINQVNDYQTTIASAVQEQLATTTEIGRNIAEVAERSYMITKNISTVAQIAQNASTGANETRTATSEVSRISRELHGLVDSFRYTR